MTVDLRGATSKDYRFSRPSRARATSFLYSTSSCTARSCSFVRAALLLVVTAQGKVTEIPINGPSLFAFDSEDNLYVVEMYGRRILKIDNKTKSVVVLAGNGKECCFKEVN